MKEKEELKIVWKRKKDRDGKEERNKEHMINRGRERKRERESICNKDGKEKERDIYCSHLLYHLMKI